MFADVLFTVLVYILIPLLLAGSYLRIIYIFRSKHKYYKRECFQIIIQLGVVQCLTVPAVVIFGIENLLGQDPSNITATGVIGMWSASKTDCVLALVLALDRVNVVIGLPRYESIAKSLKFFGWTFGIAHFILLHTPLCVVKIPKNVFGGYFDYNKPFSYELEVAGMLVVFTTTTFKLLSYIHIFHYLFFQRHQMQTVRLHVNEKVILIQGVVKFVADMFALFLFHYYRKFMAENALSEFTKVSLLCFDKLLLPQMLHLWLIRSLRRDFFFCCFSEKKKPMTVTLL